MPKPPRLPPAQTLKIRPPPQPPRREAAGAAGDGSACPLPAWIAPCLPTLVDKPPVGPEWLHEIKWDGYRVSAYLDHGRVAIYTRNGHDWTHRFPAIAAAVAALPIHSAVIDGEAVALDEQGRASFSLLQAALGTSGRGPGNRQADEATALRLRPALPRRSRPAALVAGEPPRRARDDRRGGCAQDPVQRELRRQRRRPLRLGLRP